MHSIEKEHIETDMSVVAYRSQISSWRTLITGIVDVYGTGVEKANIVKY